VCFSDIVGNTDRLFERLQNNSVFQPGLWHGLRDGTTRAGLKCWWDYWFWEIRPIPKISPDIRPLQSVWVRMSVGQTCSNAEKIGIFALQHQAQRRFNPALGTTIQAVPTSKTEKWCCNLIYPGRFKNKNSVQLRLINGTYFTKI